jgi:hypothetical protein
MAVTVAVVVLHPPARSPTMMVQLRIQDPLGQRLLQRIRHAVLPKRRLRV